MTDPSAGDPAGDDGASPERVAELADRLGAARERLAAAARDAGRDPEDVELLVVTKFHPASDVRALVDQGCRAFGESREPEAGRKAAAVRAATGETLRFDMIGTVQRRKATSIARWADRVHSVDRDVVVEALARGVDAARDDGDRDGPLEVLVQVNLDGDPSRGGVVLDELDAVADHVAGSDQLRLCGSMVIAPQTRTPDHWMEQAAAAHARLVAAHPEATVFSAGMSGDLEEAVRHGSTCVRVGTAILGERPLRSP
ncbi:YggS family pyridoxal phosphate-dependent enzyme [Williamsia sp. SKLECPSW1]